MSFFFNDTATTEIYTLSLHDALPIYKAVRTERHKYIHWVQKSTTGAECDELYDLQSDPYELRNLARSRADRKSTRLNSSHANISYAVFCLKKNKSDRWNAHRPRITVQ